MVEGFVPRLRRAIGKAHGTPAAPTRVEALLPYKRDFLRAIDIFRDLSMHDLEALERSTRMTTAPRGRIIYRQGDTAEGLFLLKKGRVRLAWYGHGGRRLELAVLEPGTFFGDMPLLGQRMRHADAEALDDCTLCVMSQADIERQVLAKPEVALRMLEVLGRRLAETEQRLEDMTYRGVPARLASVLLRLGAEHDNVIEGRTHQDLGDIVGAYRETITAVLDRFQTAGYIELGRRRIRIVNADGLSAVLGN